MKKILPTLTTGAILASAALFTASAQAWTLVDDFESYSTGVLDGVFPFATNGGSGEVQILSGIPGTNGSNAAWFNYGTVVSGAGDVWFEIDLPEDIPLNGTGTVYFRVWQQGYDLTYILIGSKVAAGEQPDNTAIWGTMSSIFRYGGADPFAWDARDGSAYQPSNPSVTPDLQTWYDVWMVMDNSYDDQGTQTGTYQVYVQGPNDSDPVLMSFGSGMTTDLAYRSQVEDTIKTLSIASNAFNVGKDPWLIDDIYFTQGACTTNPTMGGTCDGGVDWCGETPDDNGWLDSGDFLGNINVSLAPGGTGWVYSFELATFVYLTDCPPSSGGAWVYVLNSN
jgi:hypothetical protein